MRRPGQSLQRPSLQPKQICACEISPCSLDRFHLTRFAWPVGSTRTLGRLATGLCDGDHLGRFITRRRPNTYRHHGGVARLPHRHLHLNRGSPTRVDSRDSRVPSSKMVVPARANQGNAVSLRRLIRKTAERFSLATNAKRLRGDQARTRRLCRSCPRNCKRRAGDHLMPLGFSDPGKVVNGRDPRARRPATNRGCVRTRRAGCSEAL